MCIIARAILRGQSWNCCLRAFVDAGNRLKRMRLKSLLLRPNERYHRRSSYTSICQSLSFYLSFSRPRFLSKRVWRLYKLQWRVRANVARGKRARRGWRNKKGTVCPQHFASTCSLHSYVCLYIDDWKGFTSPERAGTGMLTSHGEELASQAPNEKYS